VSLKTSIVKFGREFCLGVAAIAALAVPCSAQQDWPRYNGQDSQQHYSSLQQINRSNVSRLKIAWSYDTGEQGGLKSNPIVIGRILYTATTMNHVIALDAATGKLIWKFSGAERGGFQARGVSYWTDGKESRIFVGFGHFLYAIDAATGNGIPAFGENGRVDLRKGLGENYREQNVSLTTTGAIYKDLIIVGGANPETHPAPPGDIRAYDVRTGALRWTFHTIPHPGEFGYDTWPKDAWKDAGAANNWAGMTVDTRRGIVYVPTGSAVFDFYGGDRVGDDLFADTLLALDAETGKRIWHFQGVRHDLWDHDFPAAPVLLTVRRNGKAVDAIAQTTKSGHVFLLDRTNGKPLFPLEEKQYPASNVPGEFASPTQVLPKIPAPFTQQSVTLDSLTERTPEAHAWAVKQFNTFISNGQFVPPSVDKLTLVMPGFAGGGEWGGPAVDPKSGVLFVNANDTAWVVGLTANLPAMTIGGSVYQTQCSLCHGVDRAGSSEAPDLRSIGTKLSDKQISETVTQGKGRMPSFGSLRDDEVYSLVQYLKHPDAKPTEAAPSVQDSNNKLRSDMPYKTIGFRQFLDPEGYPATAPPWGTLSAIDMNTGKYLWKIPFGEYPELAAIGMGNTGTDNYGGPIVTAGGLLFIGASVFDKKFHAYDTRTGKLLWQVTLPYSGLATPCTYMVDGKQYVVIPAGGGQTSNKPTGSVFVAYALP